MLSSIWWSKHKIEKPTPKNSLNSVKTKISLKVFCALFFLINTVKISGLPQEQRERDVTDMVTKN